MAAITFATTAANGTTLDAYNPALRTATAQATTGQTDWFWVPSRTKVLKVYFNLTANAGTTPLTTVSLVQAYPATLDDGDTVTIVTSAANIDTASFHVYEVGPTLTTANNDNVSADGFKVQNSPIPTVLGITVLNDRTTGNETYTYTLAAECQR